MYPSKSFIMEKNSDRKRHLLDRRKHALTGKVALVTGASSGLGRAIALALAQVDADLVLLACSADDLRRVITELTSSGRRVITFPDSGSRLSVHEAGEARHDHQHLFRGRQTRLGACLSVLSFQIWLNRLRLGTRGFGKGPWDSGLRPLPGGMAIHWGTWSTAQHAASGTEPFTCHQSITPI
jgi:short chain dehydrogenase